MRWDVSLNRNGSGKNVSAKRQEFSYSRRVPASSEWPDDRPRIRLRQSVRHRKRDHETYVWFHRGMEHHLHMCQSMCNTRSRLQSSTRLLAATKARASPNQINKFSPESHSRQPPPPPHPCLQRLCLHDLSPTSRIYINWRPTLIFV